MKTLLENNEVHYKNEIGKIKGNIVEIHLNKESSIFEVENIRSIKLIKQKKIIINLFFFIISIVLMYFITAYIVDFLILTYFVLLLIFIFYIAIFYDSKKYTLEIKLQNDEKIKYQINKNKKNEVLLFLTALDYHKFYNRE